MKWKKNGKKERRNEEKKKKKLIIYLLENALSKLTHILYWFRQAPPHTGAAHNKYIYIYTAYIHENPSIIKKKNYAAVVPVASLLAFNLRCDEHNTQTNYFCFLFAFIIYILFFFQIK